MICHFWVWVPPDRLLCVTVLAAILHEGQHVYARDWQLFCLLVSSPMLCQVNSVCLGFVGTIPTTFSGCRAAPMSRLTDLRSPAHLLHCDICRGPILLLCGGHFAVLQPGLRIWLRHRVWWHLHECLPL